MEKQEKALADCDTMYDELTWYMIANSSTLRYNSSRGEFDTLAITLCRRWRRE